MSPGSRPHRRILTVLALGLAFGCGEHDHADDDGFSLSISGTQVRMRCGAGDCRAAVVADDGINVSLSRTIGGTREDHFRVVPRVTDVDVETGAGNDVFRIEDFTLQGSLRVVMGDGDDFVDLFDGSAIGPTHIDLGAGNDRANFEPRLAATRFRVDAGPGDDDIDARGVCFPEGNVMLGGDGTDTLLAPSSFIEGGERIGGFEGREVFEQPTGWCRDLE